MDKLETLKAIGFEEVGYWTLENSQLIYALEHLAKNKNVLYAFVCNNNIKYIGKTVCTLEERMNGYKKPGVSQITNKKNKLEIENCLKNGNRVAIWALADRGLLHYGNFHINLAAGLEDSLINEIKPEWNNKGLFSCG